MRNTKGLTPGRKGKKMKSLPALPTNKLDLPSGEVMGLSYREISFCHHYLMDYNAQNAYLKAGYNSDPPAHAYNLLKREPVIKYVKALQSNMEQTSGVTRLRVIRELEKMAFTSMGQLRNNSWLSIKEFSELTEDQKACISEVTTEVKTLRQQYDEEEAVTTTASVEYVKIKLYDKQKALDMLNKMLGFDAPLKVEHVNDRKAIADLFPPLPPAVTK